MLECFVALFVASRREVVDAPSSSTVAANAGRSARSSKSGKRQAVCDVLSFSCQTPKKAGRPSKAAKREPV